MLSVGIIILITLLAIWLFGTFVKFFYYIRHRNFCSEGIIAFFVSFFDALLWPGDIINLCFYKPRERTNREYILEP